ncbi:MAG: BACON domain-containing protein [Bacteroidales bacterium]|nr:BACON domain-containing protein [Bacteroidales bacterium]
MKFKHLLLLLASAAFVAVACEKNDEKKPEEKDTTPVPEISVITTAFPSIADAGGTLEVTISSNVEWSVSIPETASWLSASPASGAAGEGITITFTAAANESYDKRSATVTVGGENKKGSDSAEFTISQKQKDALILSDDVIEVGYAGETINIVLQANSDISYMIAEDAQSWIVPVQPESAPTRALVESTVSFNVLANPVKEAREGVITFTNAAGDETVTVKQEALPEPDPEISLDAMSVTNVPVDGDVIKVALTSNMPWVATLADGVDWLTVSPASGEAGENVEITFTIQANPNNDGRFTSVTFTCTNAEDESKSVTFGVSQNGLNIPSDIHISTAAELIQFATDYNSGAYAPVIDKLTATLDADITFDAESSAAFVSLGTDTNTFNGAFDGANHAFAGLTATAPLFANIGASGSVANLIVAASNTFTFTHPADADAFFGSVAGVCAGEIKNVVVAANVTLSDAADVAFETSLGGIAGVVSGTIEGSTYAGALSVPEGFASAQSKIMIGGIAGKIDAEGTVKTCTLGGTIENEGQMVAADESEDNKRNPQLMIGGIVGQNSGTVDVCTAANHGEGVSVTLNDGTDHVYTGTVFTHSVNAYHYAIAGIAGRNDGTVSNSTNNATIVNIFSAERGTSGNMNGRYADVAGIAGFNGAEGTVSGSTNNGAIIDRANPKVHHVGGIVGQNRGTVSSCDNTATGAIGVGTSHASPYGPRMLNVGGIIGTNQAGSTVINVHNIGAITVSRLENATGITSCLGGIIGDCYTALDGSEGGTITNTGDITQSSGIQKCAEPTEQNDYGLYLGGIVGYTRQDIKDVTNSGAIKYTCSNKGTESTAGGAHYVQMGGVAGKAISGNVDHCINSGTVTFVASATNKSSSYVVYDYNYLGGIVGNAVNATIKGGCDNSGNIKGGDNSQNKNTANTFWVGGIVGCISGNSSMTNCALSGAAQVNNDHWSNRDNGEDGQMAGGIAGQILGTSEAVIAVSNCSVGAEATVVGRRGNIGGIAGSAKYAEVSACTVPIDFTGSGFYYGGIAGWAINSTISNCTYSGDAIKSSQFSATRGGGGIVAKLTSSSSITNCSSSVTTITKDTGAAITPYGGIAAVSEEGTTISGCHYKSTIQICSDTNFTGNDNVADL